MACRIFLAIRLTVPCRRMPVATDNSVVDTVVSFSRASIAQNQLSNPTRDRSITVVARIPLWRRHVRHCQTLRDEIQIPLTPLQCGQTKALLTKRATR